MACGVAILCGAAPAPAATVYVPSEQETIQDGIDAAGDGGTVIVAPGTYDGPGNRGIDLGGMNVMLESSDGALTTFIDGEASYRAFYFHSGEDTTCVVDGFTIMNCVGDYGGAVRLQNASPTFSSCIFEDNTATSAGGALHASMNCAPRFEICSFNGNTSQRGGAVQMDGSAGLFWNCDFTDNAAAGGWGGALNLKNIAETRFESCDFSGNEANWGGALCSGDAESSFESCVFTANEATWGGGIYIQTNYNQPVFSNCTVVDNAGSGFWVIDADPVITRSIVAFDRTGAGIICTGMGEPEISHCYVFGNAGGDSLCGSYADNAFDDPRLCAFHLGNVDLCSNSDCLPSENPWGEHIGARPSGCPDCEAPVRPSSWSTIKGIYRSVK